MSDTTFVTLVTTIATAWCQDVNDLVYKGRNPNFVTSTGSANAQVITLPSSLYVTPIDGDVFTFKAGYTNTGATTFTLVGSATVGPLALQTEGNALLGGEIRAGAIITVRYKASGTTFQLESPSNGYSTYDKRSSGANAIAFSYHNFTLGRMVNVKTDYGATGDGTTDDATAIQNALTDLNTAGGGTLFYPKGTYLVGTKLTTYANVTNHGTAYGAVTIKAKNSLNDRIMVNAARDIGSGSDANVILSNIIFDCNGTNQSGSTAPTFSRTSRHAVYNCEFKNPYDSLYLLTGSPDVTLNLDALYDGVYFNGVGQTQNTDVVNIGSATDVRMRNCRAKGAKTSSGQSMLSIAIINGFSIVNSWLDGDSNGTPISVYGVRGGKIDGCEILNSAEWGVRIQNWAEIAPEKDLNGFDIINNNIHDNAFDGVAVYHQGTIARVPLNVTIANNKIWNNQRSGILTVIANGLQIFGNSIYNNSLNGAGNYQALRFDGGFTGATHVKNVQVRGNRIYDSQGTPTQTKLYLLDYVENFIAEKNIVANITTVQTITNSTNYAIYDGTAGLSDTYLGSLTRNTATATGVVAYTGVGFKPRLVRFLSTVVSTTGASWGSDDGTTARCVAKIVAGNFDTYSSESIANDQGGGASQVGHISTLTDDGFEISWTKAGSPSGTLTVTYEAFR